MRRRETQHNGFLFELNSKLVLHRPHHRVAQDDQFGGGRVAEIHEREGVAGGDCGAPHRKTLVKTGLFYQPCRGQLHPPVSCRISGNVFGTAFGLEGYLRQSHCRNDRILEEGACTPAIWAALSCEHSLLLTDRPHRLVDLAKRRLLSSFKLSREVTLDVGVSQSGLSPGPQLVRHSGHDVSPARLRIEETSPVTEAAGLVVQIDEGAGLEIVGAHPHDGLGNLLPIGTDVLDGSTPGVPGNARQTLYAGVAAINRIEHDVVPILARADLEQNALSVPALALRHRHADTQDHPVKSRVAHQQVASSPQNKQRQVSFLREAHHLRYLGFTFHFTEKTRRATDPKRRVRGKRDELLKLQRGTRHGLRVQHRPIPGNGRSSKNQRKGHKVKRKGRYGTLCALSETLASSAF